MPAADVTTQEKLILCPYCGSTQRRGEGADVGRCRSCGGLFEPLSQRATQISMGPWYVRDRRNPFRPGCSYEVLRKMAAAGRLKPHSVIRGPTTRQFWSMARHVPGIAHLLGRCHACGTHVKPDDAKCHDCGAPFIEVDERNDLGLQFPTKEDADAAQEQLAREVRGVTGQRDKPRRKKPREDSGPNAKSDKPRDLLEDLLGSPPRVPAESQLNELAPPRAAAALGSGEVLDFAPSEAGSGSVDLDPPAMSPLVLWLLVGLNLVGVAAVVLLIVLWLS